MEHEELPASMKSFANPIRWNRDRGDALSDDLMSDDIHASPVSIDL
jgi:hypothetical protein